ncbi:MAG TPA: hypothetical protein VFL77_11180 [Solirubrobacterales bacterium]|nr:hypothetical protein [Solirubrobacterales bacterium]
MNRGISFALVAAALVLGATAIGAGVAAAEQPVKTVVGKIETEFNGGFSPKVLSKKKPTPISFDISGKIRTLDPADEGHPPALKEFLLEGDKHASISVKGIPVCKPGQLQAQDTAHARKICGPALVGSGKTEVGIKFPEQPEIPVKSELLVFNGGFTGGVTTLFIHAYITVPTPAAIVTTVKVKKIHKGRYGLGSVSTIPKIAGGSGSVKSFSLTLQKGILSATCPDGHLNARGSAILADGTKLSGGVVRPCTGKG